MSRGEAGKLVSLPQVLEVLEADDARAVVLLIEEAVELKDRLDEAVDDEDYDPKRHLARRYKEVKDKLEFIQNEYGLDGLRHNDVVFAASAVKGRASLDKALLIKELLSRGVPSSKIEESIAAATKVGEGYVKKELRGI